MSLVSTYVRAIDGKLYRNPVLRGEGWFLCFDDDEPPELVVLRGQTPPGFTFFKKKKQTPRRSMRCFGKAISAPFQDADAYFGRLTAPIPVPEEHDGFVSSPERIRQGVVYDPKPKVKSK